MKRLFFKILIITLPFAVYFAIFFIFEPYNYLGLKSGGNTNSVIYRTKSFLRQPKDNIILGDSRLAHLDIDYIGQLTDKEYQNLAFGGASIGESIDLFYFAKKHNKNLKKAVLGVSFYTLNSYYYKDRTAQIETALDNPFAYMLNFDYNIEMLNEIKLNLNGQKSGVLMQEGIWGSECFVDTAGNPLPHRQNLLDYAQIIKDASTPYKLNNDAVDKIIKMSNFCNENSIEFTVVFLPANSSITELVIEPLGIDKLMTNVVETLRSGGVRVLDYEADNTAFSDDNIYYDGFHLDPVRGLAGFTKQLFLTDAA